MRHHLQHLFTPAPCAPPPPPSTAPLHPRTLHPRIIACTSAPPPPSTAPHLRARISGPLQLLADVHEVAHKGGVGPVRRPLQSGEQVDGSRRLLHRPPAQHRVEDAVDAAAHLRKPKRSGSTGRQAPGTLAHARRRDLPGSCVHVASPCRTQSGPGLTLAAPLAPAPTASCLPA